MAAVNFVVAFFLFSAAEKWREFSVLPTKTQFFSRATKEEREPQFTVKSQTITNIQREAVGITGVKYLETADTLLAASSVLLLLSC